MFYLGELAQPAENVLVTDNDKLADCLCRGGAWHAVAPSQGYCTPVPGAQPTGKYYNIAQRGCAFLPSVLAQQQPLPTKPKPSQDWIWWLVGISAVVVGTPIVIRVLRRRRKGKS
jgi:hypothetical protein